MKKRWTAIPVCIQTRSGSAARACVAVLAAALLCNGIHAGECEPGWLSTFGCQPGVENKVRAVATFDDGSGGGPALYAGGLFSTAGGVLADRIAKWDGISWSTVGSGMNDDIFALAVFDDGRGGGPALYAGGKFTMAGGAAAHRIARWNGTSWSALGTGMNNAVDSLTVFDDGTGGGPALYAGGLFTTAGGVTVNRVAKWSGTSWSALGSGMNDGINALTVFDDGTGGGPALYAGGNFTSAGGVGVNYIAKWNGASWSALGSGLGWTVYALTVFDDGSGGGPALYAGGGFITAGGVAAANYIAKWNGTSWSELGSGMNDWVNALAVFDDGSGGGPALYAGGWFTMAGGEKANSIAKWNGTSWSALGSGIMYGSVWALTVFDDRSGGGAALYAGGFYTTAGGLVAYSIAKWDDTSWSALGSGLNRPVVASTVFDDGSGGGPALYAGGYFTTAGGVVANYIAKWNGTSWSAVGGGINSTVLALTVFDDGSGGGPALYAGGEFTEAGGVEANRVAKWNGTSWSALGSGMNGPIFALAVFDDGSGGGPELHAGGNFNATSEGVPVNFIAKWNGRSWSALGNGVKGYVFGLTVFDDGSVGGPALYAGGLFATAGDVRVNSIAKWNGRSWSALGSGVNDFVWALTVFDDGTGGGPALYAGGYFTSAGDVSANSIAKWNGTSWSALGSGMKDIVRALTVFDDGTGAGPVLYAGGDFTAAGGASASSIAKWNDNSWSAIGSGMNYGVHAMSVFDDGKGGGPALYAGGDFTASTAGDSFLARWQGCPTTPIIPADLNGDGVVNSLDLGILLSSWSIPRTAPGCGGTVPCAADLNLDGSVNTLDLGVLLSSWTL